MSSMSDLNTLLSTEIPEGLQSLSDSNVNLARVAEYCQSNYFQCDNKRDAIDETKRYTTQSLASVAYQVNTLAYHFLQLLDLQGSQLDEMAAQASHIAQAISIHKEKVSRREIGVLTSSKTPSRQYKILAPATPEKPVKYVRKPIDYALLDEIGCGARNRQMMRTSMSSMSSMRNNIPPPTMMSTLPPNTKPPTPPMGTKMGTLRTGDRSIYRTAPAVAPPQVPSHYAPNYPHLQKRQNSQIEQRGYTTLPLQTAHPQLQASQNQVPLQSSIPFRQRDIQPMSHQQIIYAENKSLGIVTGPASPPLPPPPMDHSLDDSGPSLVPKTYLEKVIAVYDYAAEREDELSFQENSLIYVLKKNDDGWYEGVLNGVTGLFPGNYVEPCAL
ncbi:abl interactor 2 [Folsomia candida]|uniref:Abl interactor 1 n=1 Tax=Folsomia candida TaxID=158441 RepID=A0A226EH83_FOLCA|nr:abl interactor 2 [Folsomia candida]OXA57023.1 Abl interactor 1 [Folsomia candida]